MARLGHRIERKSPVDRLLVVSAGELIAFAVSVFICWLVIRQAVAAALRHQVVKQNDLILQQLAEQTRLLGSIARDVGGRPYRDGGKDHPTDLAARIAAASTPAELGSLMAEVNASGDRQAAELYVARNKHLKKMPSSDDDLPPPPAARKSSQ